MKELHFFGRKAFEKFKFFYCKVIVCTIFNIKGFCTNYIKTLKSKLSNKKNQNLRLKSE